MNKKKKTRLMPLGNMVMIQLAESKLIGESLNGFVKGYGRTVPDLFKAEVKIDSEVLVPEYRDVTMTSEGKSVVFVNFSEIKVKIQ